MRKTWKLVLSSSPPMQNRCHHGTRPKPCPNHPVLQMYGTKAKNSSILAKKAMRKVVHPTRESLHLWPIYRSHTQRRELDISLHFLYYRVVTFAIMDLYEHFHVVSTYTFRSEVSRHARFTSRAFRHDLHLPSPPSPMPACRAPHLRPSLITSARAHDARLVNQAPNVLFCSSRRRNQRHASTAAALAPKPPSSDLETSFHTPVRTALHKTTSFIPRVLPARDGTPSVNTAEFWEEVLDGAYDRLNSTTVDAPARVVGACPTIHWSTYY